MQHFSLGMKEIVTEVTSESLGRPRIFMSADDKGRSSNANPIMSGVAEHLSKHMLIKKKLDTCVNASWVNITP